MMGRSPCCSNEGLNRGAWTEKEDMILSEYIQIHGDGRWKKLTQKAGLKRCAKSCRLRWLNYLRPDIKRGNISPDEEDLIVRLHRLLGNRWSLIAGRLPGRTDNEIQNYWNTHLCKKLPLRNQSQPKWKQRNPESRSKDPSSLQNPVLKITPIKTTIAEQHSEIVIPNGCSNSENSACGLKLCSIKKTANFSMSGCDLLMNDSITLDDFEHLASEMTGANVVEEAVTNSVCSMSTLRVEDPPHSDHFAGVTATLPESLFDMNKGSYPDWNLFLSAVTCSADLELEEFYREGLEISLKFEYMFFL